MGFTNPTFISVELPLQSLKNVVCSIGSNQNPRMNGCFFCLNVSYVSVWLMKIGHSHISCLILVVVILRAPLYIQGKPPLLTPSALQHHTLQASSAQQTKMGVPCSCHDVGAVSAVSPKLGRCLKCPNSKFWEGGLKKNQQNLATSSMIRHLR